MVRRLFLLLLASVFVRYLREARNNGWGLLDERPAVVTSHDFWL